jgi:hypothetical protein
MGLNLRQHIGAIIIGGFLPLHASGANPLLEPVAWPGTTPCVACITLQFDVLEMRLPASLVGKVFVSGTDATAIHLIPAGLDGRSSVYLRSLPGSEPAGKYKQLIALPDEVKDARKFFDRLGQFPPSSAPWVKIRKIEGFENAIRYTKASKGGVHAYWIRAVSPNSQYVYLVVDGNPLVYAFSGEISETPYEAILSNLKISPAP